MHSNTRNRLKSISTLLLGSMVTLLALRISLVARHWQPSLMQTLGCQKTTLCWSERPSSRRPHVFIFPLQCSRHCGFCKRRVAHI